MPALHQKGSAEVRLLGDVIYKIIIWNVILCYGDKCSYEVPLAKAVSAEIVAAWHERLDCWENYLPGQVESLFFLLWLWEYNSNTGVIAL